MGENDVIQIILTELNRIKDKLDDISDRISALETKVEEKQKQQDEINEKVNGHEIKLQEGTGIKNFIAWLIATGIGVLAFLKDFLPHIK